jgi:hypothetical protein
MACDDDEAACIVAVTRGRARVGASHVGDGRGLFTAVSVLAGDAVFEEAAFVCAPGPWGSWECVCHACMVREEDDAPLTRCTGCRWAHWCSEACREAHTVVAHTAAECAAMAKLRYRTLDLPGAVVLAGRMLRPDAAVAGDDGALRVAQAKLAATLVGASDAVPPLTRADFEAWAPTVASLAAADAASARPCAEACVDSLCALLRNEFRVLDDRDVSVGAALFPAAARMNHACAPNVKAFTTDAGWVLRVEALTALAPGEELRLSYVDAGGSRETRAAHLRARFLFDCACGAEQCCGVARGAAATAGE